MLWPKLELMVSPPGTPNLASPCVDSSQAERCQLCVPQAEVYDVSHRVSNGKFGLGKQNQHVSSPANVCGCLLSPLPSLRSLLLEGHENC